MKLIKTALISITLFALLLTNAKASNRQVGGLIIGGSTGAIVGNVVGKNVESTVIGAAVGGVMGYAIGNELDKNQISFEKHTDVVAHSQRNYKRPRSSFENHNRYDNYRKTRHRDYPRYHPYSGKCRKVITVKKRHGKAKRIISTACGKSYRDHNRNNNRHRYNDRYYR